MIDFNDFFYFAKVVDHGGFTAAGRALNQPKSKLSKRIAAMEAQLGVRLIERSSRRFVVTEIGAAFAERARVMLAEAEQAVELVDQLRGEPAGVVRFSCPGGVMARPLAKLIPQFLARYPKIKLIVSGTDRHVDLISERIDLVMRVRTVMQDEGDLIVRVLARARQILVASPAFLDEFGPFETPADLNRSPTITMPSWVHQATWHLTGADEKELAYIHQPRLSYEDFDTLRNAAIAGLGVAQLLDQACHDDLAAGRLVHILPSWRSREGTIYLGFTSRRGLRPAVRALIDYLEEGFSNVQQPY